MTKKLISKCCSANIIVAGGQQEDSPQGKTHYYICENCGKPCDIKPCELIEDSEVLDFVPFNTSRLIGLSKEDYIKEEEYEARERCGEKPFDQPIQKEEEVKERKIPEQSVQCPICGRLNSDNYPLIIDGDKVMGGCIKCFDYQSKEGIEIAKEILPESFFKNKTTTPSDIFEDRKFNKRRRKTKRNSQKRTQNL